MTRQRRVSGPRTGGPRGRARRSCFLLPWLYVCLSAPGCGGSEDAPVLPFPGPGEERSCENLVPGDPRTGATFCCVACSRHWRWEVRAPAAALFVLLELDCSSTTDARLGLFAPGGAPVWQSQMRAGQRGAVCIPHRPAVEGAYVLQLTGEGPGSLTSFSGSIWFSVYDTQGHRIEPVTEAAP